MPRCAFFAKQFISVHLQRDTKLTNTKFYIPLTNVSTKRYVFFSKPSSLGEGSEFQPVPYSFHSYYERYYNLFFI